MDELIKKANEEREEMRRRATWRRLRVHRLGGAHLDTNELEARLVEQAEARRRLVICTFLDAMNVSNTARSNRAAIKRYWSGVEHSFGPAPDPVELVGWRNIARLTIADRTAVPMRRRSGGAR